MSSEYIRRLVCGYSRENRRNKAMMVLQGFVDDSGSGRGATGGNIYTLAGFLSTAERWQDFSDEWDCFSNEEPRTPDFHMANAYRMKGSYRWQDEAQRDKKIQGFVRLIKKHALYRIDSVLAWPNYEMVVRGRVPAYLDNPYFLLFYNVMLSAASFMDRLGIDGTVDWIFDEQGAVGDAALSWYRFVKQSVPALNKRLGSTPIFRHDSQVLPLKAADIYAWQIRRHLDIESPQGVAHNDYIDSLLDIHGVSNAIEGEHMKDFVNSIGHGLQLNSRMLHFVPNPQESLNEKQP